MGGVVEYRRGSRVSLRSHPTVNEKWLQSLISNDPAILGLGDVSVRDVERRQPHAGRLDLLLSDPVSLTRYEVEIQLGPTDESHLIRTIEYWDIERKRYPQYEHVAVIVAEEITGRFLNVIGLFNGFIPLVAIQIQAIEVENMVTLVATKVMDVIDLATDEEDEAGALTDRTYWEGRGSPTTVDLADQMLLLIRERTGQDIALKYNKLYIGLARDGVADNFVFFQPKKQHLITAIRIPKSDELTDRLEQAGIELLEYGRRGGRYRMRLTGEDLAQRRDLLGQLVEMAAGASEKVI